MERTVKTVFIIIRLKRGMMDVYANSFDNIDAALAAAEGLEHRGYQCSINSLNLVSKDNLVIKEDQNDTQ